MFPLGAQRDKRRGLLLEQPIDDPQRCRQCDGACCRAFPSVQLSWEEYFALQALGARRLEFTLDGHYHLLIENGCEFLKQGRCAIYPHRPDICRRFYCIDHENRSTVEKSELNDIGKDPAEIP